MNARAKFRVALTPTDRQLWAIGTIVVAWASVEQMLGLIGSTLTDGMPAARTQFEQTRASQRRMAKLEELILDQIRIPERDALLALIAEARNLQDQRDKVVHGVWGDGSERNVTVFNRMKPSAPFNWTLAYGDLVKIALRMDTLLAELMQIPIKVTPGQSDILLSENLRRLRRVDWMPPATAR